VSDERSARPDLVVAVTWPRTLALALIGDLLTAGFLAYLRLDAGPACRDLSDVRASRPVDWSRYVGDQAMNAAIVLLVVSAVPSLALYSIAAAALGAPLPLWADVVAALPLALGMTGLVLAYLWRGRRKAWTSADVRTSLDLAARARPLWLGWGVVVSVVLASLLRHT
jgi:hypothetical protein